MRASSIVITMAIARSLIFISTTGAWQVSAASAGALASTGTGSGSGAATDFAAGNPTQVFS